MKNNRRVSNTVNHSHVLLVEGEADRGFLELICKNLTIHPDIQFPHQIETVFPKDYQADYENNVHNGKEGVRNFLNDLLAELLDSESSVKKLAAIVDADYDPKDKVAFQKTLANFQTTVSEHGFILLEDNTHGLIFKLQDSDITFGLWIMPDNQAEGTIEDFVKTCIHSDEQPLLNHAIDVVKNVPNKKFEKHNVSKAEVATLLAWQRKPSLGLYCSVEDKLIDTKHTLFQELERWLKQIFI
jgi:hypothetical protein